MSEIQPGVSETDVGEIIFERRAEILCAFDVISFDGVQNIGFREIIQILCNRIVRHLDFFLRQETLFQFCRIGQGSNGGGNKIQQDFQDVLVVADVFSFDDVLQIRFVEQVF